jgi:hypothetical protein
MSADEDNMTAWRKLVSSFQERNFMKASKPKEAGTEVECPSVAERDFPR